MAPPPCPSMNPQHINVGGKSLRKCPGKLPSLFMGEIHDARDRFANLPGLRCCPAAGSEMRRCLMRSRQSAFSLLETLVATAITVGIGAVAFQLFHQNERLFRDQAVILEMQQGARVVVSQIGDD